MPVIDTPAPPLYPRSHIHHPTSPIPHPHTFSPSPNPTLTPSHPFPLYPPSPPPTPSSHLPHHPPPPTPSSLLPIFILLLPHPLLSLTQQTPSPNQSILSSTLSHPISPHPTSHNTNKTSPHPHHPPPSPHLHPTPPLPLQPPHPHSTSPPTTHLPTPPTTPHHPPPPPPSWTPPGWTGSRRWASHGADLWPSPTRCAIPDASLTWCCSADRWNNICRYARLDCSSASRIERRNRRSLAWGNQDHPHGVAHRGKWPEAGQFADLAGHSATEERSLTKAARWRGSKARRLVISGLPALRRWLCLVTKLSCLSWSRFCPGASTAARARGHVSWSWRR